MRGVAVALLGLTSILLAGCSANDEAATPPATPTLAATVETPAASASPEAATTAQAPEEPRPPDSSAELAYVDPEGVVWLVSADGSERKRLMEGCAFPHNPTGVPEGLLRWSPDGSRLACAGADGWAWGVAVSGTGGEPIPLVKNCGKFFRWSPTGAWFDCGPDRIVSADGTEQPTVEGSFRSTNSTWATTADLLVLEAAEPDLDGHRPREIVDLDGRVLLRIPREYGSIRDIAWHPDAKAVAYSGPDGLMVFDLPEGTRRDLDTEWLDVQWTFSTQIEWALGGSALVVWGSSAIHFVNASTGDPLGTDPIPAHDAFAVAPDGVRVAVLLWGDTRNQVRVFDLEAGTAINVAGTEVRFEHGGQPGALVFSSDGARVCWIESPFNVPRGQPPRCFDADGSNLEEVTTAIAHSIRTPVGENDQPAFASDLRRVAYVAGEAEPRLWVSDIDGSDAVEVGAILSDLAFAWRP